MFSGQSPTNGRWEPIDEGPASCPQDRQFSETFFILPSCSTIYSYQLFIVPFLILFPYFYLGSPPKFKQTDDVEVVSAPKSLTHILLSENPNWDNWYKNNLNKEILTMAFWNRISYWADGKRFP